MRLIYIEVMLCCDGNRVYLQKRVNTKGFAEIQLIIYESLVQTEEFVYARVPPPYRLLPHN